VITTARRPAERTTPQGQPVTDRRQPAAIRWRRRLLAMVAAAMLTAAASASPAQAHIALISSTPADGASVPQTPAAVRLTFDEPAVAMGTEVLVTGPSGEVQQGRPRLVDNSVTQDLAPGAAAGVYTVTWRVTSLDGHPVSGALAFTAKAAGVARLETTPTPGPTVSSSRGLPWWMWVVIGLVVVTTAGAGTTAIRRARTRRA
jgi:methionine-rich copper-binding protein CopC